MLRNKEPELAEKIDSSFGCFDLGFYRVNFVFGSRHLIIVLRSELAQTLVNRNRTRKCMLTRDLSFNFLEFEK